MAEISRRKFIGLSLLSVLSLGQPGAPATAMT